MLNTTAISEQVNNKVVNMPAKGTEMQIEKRTKENEKAQKLEEAKNKLEAYQTMQAELMEKLNIENTIPSFFFVTEHGVFKANVDREGEITSFSNISGTPVFIDRVEEDYDTHTEKIVLAFYLRGRLRRESFGTEEVNSANAILKSMGMKGISLDSTTARDMTVYIRKLKDLNCNSEKDNHIVLNSIGWKNNETFFSYPTPEDKPVVIGKIGTSDDCKYSDEIKEKFMQSKNTTIYRNTFLKIFDKNVHTQLACLTALSGPFLQLMSTPNILLYFYGKSSNAKTAIMKFAQAAWYNPEKNSVTFNATTTALDNMLGQYTGTTLLIDERQSIAGDRKYQERMLTQFIYSAVNGIGRARAQKNQDINHGLRKIQKYHLSIMATGEEKILGDDAKSGAQNRIMEIPVDEQIFNQNEAREIYRVIQVSYGGLGVEFLQKAMQLIENENIDLTEKNFYLQCDVLKLTKSEKSERQVNAISTLAVVDYLLRRTIFCDDEQLATNHMNTFIKNTVKFLLSQEKTDEVQKSVNLIDEFCTEYDGFIKDVKNIGSYSNTKIYGYKAYNELSGDTTYYISTNVLKQYTDSRDESLSKLLKELYKKGLLKKYNESYKIRKSFRNTNVSGIFYIYTKRHQEFSQEDVGVENHAEEIAEVNTKIDEKHNVVREQQQVLVDMSKNETNTTINDLYGEEIVNNCDENDRPW